MQITIPAKYRTIFYWATGIVSFLSIVLAGVGAAFGFVDVDAIQKGATAAALVMGVLAPILALFHVTPDPE
jgi:hypothetical protein